MKPSVGEIVLFKIDTSDFGVWRPLLVTFVHDDGAVDGEVFFQVDQDRRAEWPTRKLFYGLAGDRRSAEVRNVVAGEGLGQYKRQNVDPVVDNLIATLVKTGQEQRARIEALEAANAQRGKLVAPVKALVPEKRTR